MLEEPITTENPVIIEETPRKKSTESKSTESPVVTTANEIEEMPDLSIKKQSGITFTIKQWQQVGQKIIIKMIIENTDENEPAKSIKIMSHQNTFYDSEGNTYQGTVTQVAKFVSKGDECITVLLVLGSKSITTIECNVGNTKINKIVGLNFLYQRNHYGDSSHHFFRLK